MLAVARAKSQRIAVKPEKAAEIWAAAIDKTYHCGSEANSPTIN